MSALKDLLKKYRDAALDERAKGDSFENLIQYYLKNDKNTTSKKFGWELNGQSSELTDRYNFLQLSQRSKARWEILMKVRLGA